MMGEWKEIRLGDIISIFGGFSYKGEFIGKGDKLLLGMGCVSYSDKFSLTGVRPYAGDCSDRFFAHTGDIVLATRQQSDNLPILGMPAIIPKSIDNKQVIVGTNLYRVHNNSEINNRYLFWLLKSPEYINHITACSKGTTVKMITKDAVESFTFKCPPNNIRNKISDILWDLDEKIDLLNCQNSTLEAMTETLFRQYFIENIKTKWEAGNLDSLLTVKGGSTPSTSVSEYWNGTIHWTSPRDITTLNSLFLFDTERKITDAGLSKIGSGLLPKGTLLMSSRAPVGVFAFSDIDIAINQGYIAIIDNKGYSKEFIYLWLKINIELVHSYSNGSTFMEISKSSFKSIPIDLPTKEEVKEFDNIVIPLFEKIRQNSIQIRTLKKIRDMLLPKLMSNEVKIG